MRRSEKKMKSILNWLIPVLATLIAGAGVVCGDAASAQPPSGMWEAPVFKRAKQSVEKAENVERAEKTDKTDKIDHAVQTERAQPVEQPGTAPVVYVYRVNSGDRLKISVYNAEKLTGEYPVGGDGKIAFPMLGRVAVGDLTLDEVSAELARQLGDGYLLNPNVTVDIAAYRSVYILGEVTKPGQYAYTEGMTVFQLVAQAGGFTYRANRKKIGLRNDRDPRERKVGIENGTAVAPGDTIVIRERLF